MKVCPYKNSFKCDYGKDCSGQLGSLLVCLEPSHNCPRNPKNKKVEIVEEIADSIEINFSDNAIASLEP